MNLIKAIYGNPVGGFFLLERGERGCVK